MLIKVLSFDVSSVSTGWAVVTKNKPKYYGVITIDKKLSISQKLNAFRCAVISLLCKHAPTHVVVEETYMKNVKTLKTLMQFISVINEASFNTIGKEPVLIFPNTVRSYFKLKNKKEMFEYINKRFKFNMDFKKDNDVTDALGQGLYYFELLEENNNE